MNQLVFAHSSQSFRCMFVCYSVTVSCSQSVACLVRILNLLNE